MKELFELFPGGVAVGFGLYAFYAASQPVIPPSARVWWLSKDVPPEVRDRRERAFLKMWGSFALMLGVLMIAVEFDRQLNVAR